MIAKLFYPEDLDEFADRQINFGDLRGTRKLPEQEFPNWLLQTF